MKPTAERNYRGLLWSLALIGLLLDQGSKYGVFYVLDHGGEGGQFQILPGVVELLTQFTGEQETGTGVFAALRSVSGEMLPKVNHGALFGLGGEYVTLANAIFAGISILAASAI